MIFAHDDFNVWPGPILCCCLLFTCKQHPLQANEITLARRVTDSNLCAMFHLHILSAF